MKILIVSHEYPPIGGGGANACMNLAYEFKKQGHNITVVTSWFPGLERCSREGSLSIVRLPSRRKHKEHCGFVEMLSYLGKALGKVDSLCREQKFDIVMVFFAIPSGPVGYYLKKRYGIPYIIRFGGGDIPGYQERFTFIYKLIGPYEKIIWKNAEALVANSRGLRILAEHFYNKKEIRIIPNGVNTDFFRSAPERKTKRHFRILFVSRLIERKGLQYMIPQLKDIEKKCGRRILLTVVGDGPYRQTLEKLAKRYEVSDRIIFAGQKDKEELTDYYQDADVFILPSKKEGMPNVVLEAMASGLPVVMTPCEGSDELIDGNGYAVRVNLFGDKLALLARDERRRKKMGEKSLELVRERFLWSSIADQYETLLRDACNGSAGE